MKNLFMTCTVGALIVLSARSTARSQDFVVPVVPINLEVKGEYGVASWYGEECQGNATASGELFDINRLTSAHQKFPLGTRVRVTNLRNNKSLVLRVNDRGPNIAGRVIDVSKAAAERLGFLRAGLALVEIEVVSYPRGYVPQGSKPQNQLSILD